MYLSIIFCNCFHFAIFSSFRWAKRKEAWIKVWNYFLHLFLQPTRYLNKKEYNSNKLLFPKKISSFVLRTFIWLKISSNLIHFDIWVSVVNNKLSFNWLDDARIVETCNREIIKRIILLNFLLISYFPRLPISLWENSGAWTQNQMFIPSDNIVERSILFHFKNSCVLFGLWVIFILHYFCPCSLIIPHYQLPCFSSQE